MIKLQVTAIKDSVGIVHSLPEPVPYGEIIEDRHQNGIDISQGTTHGFLLSDGSFVTQQEAIPIALVAEQVRNPGMAKEELPFEEVRWDS